MQALLASVKSMILPFLVLGFVVLVHEVAHFLMALRVRMRVLEFSIFMGPALWSRIIKGIRYSVRWIPFGGYVRIFGMEFDDETALRDPRAFRNRPIRERFVVLIAGSLANFLIAAILFFIVGCILAGVRGTNVIARIADKMPAKEAGMQPGDAIVGISGTYIRLTDDWLKMIRGTEGKIRERKGVTFYVRRRGKEIKCSAKALRKGDRLTGVYGLGEEDVDILTQMISESSGRALLISVRRNGEVLRLPVVPEEREVVDIRSGSELDEESKRGIAGWFARLRGFFTIHVVRKKRGVIGVEFLQMPPKEPVPLTQRLSYGAIMIVRETVDATYALFVLLLKLTQLYHAVGGPIRIFWEIKEHAWLSLVLQLRLIAMLSYVVGLVNLCLPIPPLDGGRLALLGVEAILRRRIDPRWELRMSMAGIALLLAFIAAISMRDIGYIINRLVGSG